MRSDVFASRTFPSRRSHQHGPPLLGRVEVPALPRRQSSYAVLRLPLPHRPPLRSSLACGLPPATRWRWRASQVSGPSSACVPRFLTPSLASASRPICEVEAAAFELPGALGSGYMNVSWPAHAAHMLARLRINESVTGPAARLATDLPGSAFGRAGFAPAGRRTRFQEFRSLLPS